jgi:RimJ/RimL family protein N-acetyltransferase
MLDTRRLCLRRWTASDVSPYSALCADPEVMRWIGDGQVRSPGECESEIHGFERAWDERGYGLFAVTLRESQEFVGFVGLSVPAFLPEILPAVEIGWRLARAHWGGGCATEAAAAVLAFGFERAHLERIVSVHRVGNEASQRVMEKLGMKLVRETKHPRLGFPLRVHAIERPAGVGADDA